MVNFEVLEKFTREEIFMVMDSLNGIILERGKIPVKEQIKMEVEANKYYNQADKKFNLKNSFESLLQKLDALTEEEAIELGKYVEFSFYSDELPLNFGLYVKDIKSLYNL